MRIYWRIMGDLRDLGEMLLFHDPCLLREYGKWCRRNGVNYVGTFKIDPFISDNFIDPLDRKGVGKRNGGHEGIAAKQQLPSCPANHETKNPLKGTRLT